MVKSGRSTLFEIFFIIIEQFRISTKPKISCHLRKIYLNSHLCNKIHIVTSLMFLKTSTFVSKLTRLIEYFVLLVLSQQQNVVQSRLQLFGIVESLMIDSTLDI